MDMLFLALLATILVALYLTPTQLSEEPDLLQIAQMPIEDSEAELAGSR